VTQLKLLRHIPNAVSSAITFIALLVMLAAVMAGIVAAEWLPGLSVVLWAGVIGIAAGAVLANSHFPNFAAHITSSIYGLFTIVVIAGTRADVAKVGDGLSGWRERVFVIADRITEFTRAASQNGTSRDTLVFILILSALFWLLGYTAAWYSFRSRRIWHVILPAGVTLFSNAYYYGGNHSMAPYLVLYLLCALVLLVQSHFADREEAWLRERVRFSPSLRGSFILAGVAIAVLSLLFSWRVTLTASAPATIRALQRFNPGYNEFMARWNRMFSTLNNYNLREVDRYDASHTLSGPRNLSPEPVMSVSLANAPPARLYWRAQSLDYYDGASWNSTAQMQLDLGVNAANAQQPVYLSRSEIQASFTLFRGTDSIRTPSQPVRANLPTRGTLAELGGPDLELLQLALPVPLLPGNRYLASGSLSLADVAQLRSARQTYPDAIATRYLQLPLQVPNRVKELAQKVASKAGADTAFDKAYAIENFLRGYMTYDEKLEAPPPGVEASDYVLYTTRRAYCDYYATAMIVMLRSLGVPARMAIGYAQGEIDPDSTTAEQTTHLVKANDAHAWVEVFFPDYGWVEFEPTANQPPIRRIDSTQPQTQEENGAALAQPPTPTPEPKAAGTPTPQPNQQNPQAQPTPPAPAPSVGQAASQFAQRLFDAFWGSWLRFLLVIPVLVALGYLALNVAERAGLGKFPPIERAYAMLSRWAHWLGIGRKTALTPYEQAEALAQRAPPVQEAARHITNLYVERRFSGPDRAISVGRDQDVDVLSLWHDAKRGLRTAWVQSRIPLIRPLTRLKLLLAKARANRPRPR
jgi:transglutaminase-like putative cysteine protease